MRDPRMRRVFFSVYAALTSLYLVWRAVFTYHADQPVYWAVFLAAEISAILSAFVFYTFIVEPSRRTSVPPAAGLSVDVLIATYNEEPALLRRTAAAARDMEYPHKTWLCDDGRRPQVRELARELGIGYITRSDNAHFKAGNLNSALAETQADFVMVLDADHVPRASFLTRTLGFFDDPKVALVQTPQVYYNVDSFQHAVSLGRRRFWHEAAVFHHEMQPGADRLNSAFFVGTGAVLRRSALSEIGGFATGSITEDIHTSMRLHARGFKSVYLDEALGFMLAPDTPFAYIRQRLRWAQGSMQILRRENPLFKRGLSFFQKMGYLNSLGGYLAAYQHLLFYVAPGLYLFARISPIATDQRLGLPIFVSHIILDLIAFRLLAAPHARLFLGECFKVLNLSIFVRASATLLSSEGLVFKVTPKGRHGGLPYDLLAPAFALFAFNLTAFAFGLLRLWRGDPHPAAVSLGLFFAGQFCVATALALAHCWQRRESEESFAFPVSAITKLLGPHGQPPRDARILRLEPETAYILSHERHAPGERLALDLRPVGVGREAPVEVLACYDAGAAGWDGHILKARPLGLSAVEKDAMERYLFEQALPNFLSGFLEAPGLGMKGPVLRDSELARSYFHIRPGIT